MRNLGLKAKLTGAAVGALMVSGAMIGAATPASAEETCPYPYVCFYNSSGHITGEFRDVTSYWQWLTSSKGAYMGRNTRHDDIVFYHFTNGQVICSPPETTYYFNSWVVDAVRIDWASTCP